MNDAQNILIFGGTFDPPHLAHTRLPPIAAKQLGCQRIIFIPASINPLKADSPPTPALHRLAMLRLAIGSMPGAEIDTLELDREGPSYTVDTLAALKDRFGPLAKLHLLIGADQALEFHRWKDWQQILEMATPAVMLRPPLAAVSFVQELSKRYEADEAEFWRSHLVTVPYLKISSTEVRRRINEGVDLSGLLDGRITDYIKTQDLYSAGTS